MRVWASTRKHFRIHEKALEISKKYSSSKSSWFGYFLQHVIASVYESMGEYSKALSFSSEKALDIRQKSLPANHPDLGCFTQHVMASVYERWASTQKHFLLIRKHLKFDKKLFLQIILSLLLPTTTWVSCMGV